MNYVRRILFAGGLLAVAPWAAHAAGTLDSAEVTRIFNQVQLLSPNRAALTAKVGDGISGQTAVQTGTSSRAELEFNDQTIARLGANSVFSFERGTRDLNLNEGVILLEVPKHAGGATINTAAVTAAVTGTTVMIEYHKGSKPADSTLKFIVLEGTMRLNLKGHLGESMLLGPGQMITIHGDVSHLPDAQIVDIDRLAKTSGLMSNQFPELKNQPYIFQTIDDQRLLKQQGKLISLNYGLFGKQKNPVLQLVNNTSQATFRTDATIPGSGPRNRTATSRPNAPHFTPAPPNPPTPVTWKVPKPPKQPPLPKPPVPPLPPPVPQPPSAGPTPPP